MIPIASMMAPFESRMTQRAMQNAAGAAPELREMLEGLSAGPSIGIGLVFMFFVMLIVGTTFGMFGGLFGALLFRKSSPRRSRRQFLNRSPYTRRLYAQSRCPLKSKRF